MAEPRPGRARPFGWSMRTTLVLLHRWSGLTIASFVGVAALTGAVLPFEETLTFATRPDAAYVAPPRPGAATLDGITITRRVERATGVAVPSIPLEVPRDHVVQLFVAARPGAPTPPYDVVWADPYSGAVRLTYRWGSLSDGVVDIVPMLYSLHYGFIAGPWGVWVFGIAALIWTIDCFVGLALTLPLRRTPRRPLPAWLARWRPAWRVRRVRGFKLTYDLHQASGLWLWPLLFVFAWSGVALTLPSVETPVMRLFGASAAYMPPPLATPLTHPPIDAHRAVTIGEAALRREGAHRGFDVERATMLYYDAGSGSYVLYARTSLDHTDAGGRTALWIDARTGRAMRWQPPTGQTHADAFVSWIEYLHMALVFGLPWRIAVSTIGLLTAGLTVTGVLIWLRKRSGRRRAAGHRAAFMRSTAMKAERR